MKEYVPDNDPYRASESSAYYLSVTILNLVVLLLQTALVYLYVNQQININVFLWQHVYCCFALLGLCYLVRSVGVDWRLYGVTFFMTAFGMVLGSAIALVMVLLIWLFHRAVDSDWLYQIGLSEEETETEQLYNRLLAHQEDFSNKSHLAPLSEIIKTGATWEKRMVIAKMARYFSPRFAKLLREAVRSPENSIRVQAATVIANIESTFSKKYIALHKRLKQDPKNTDILYQLAQHCDTYAYSGILTDSTDIEQFYKEAIKHYLRYQFLSGDDSGDLALALGRLNIRVYRNKEALKYLNVALSRCVNQTIKPELFMWYIEVLYRLEHYDDITTFCADYADWISGSAAGERIASETIELWSKRDAG